MKPLFRSARRRYNPGVSEILSEATSVARNIGWNDVRHPGRVGWLQRETGQTPYFQLFDEEANPLGRHKHVMLAWAIRRCLPAGVGPCPRRRPLRDRIVQAYEPKRYASEGRYVVIGAGIASVNEWANALDVGAKVISLLRNPSPEEQDLNTPRCLFEALGIDAFQGLDFDGRIEYLAKILKGTTPTRRSWEAKIARGRAEDRFEQIIGEIDQIEPGPAGLRIHIVARSGDDPGWLDVTGLVRRYRLQQVGADDTVAAAFGIPLQPPDRQWPHQAAHQLRGPALDLAESRLCMIGIHANTVIPHGDTIAGLKYIARRFVADCARAERLRERRFFAQAAGADSAVPRRRHAVHTTRQTEQLA